MKLLLLGSCFSQNIGEKLRYNGFDVLINPMGISFNIHSINKMIQRSIAMNYFKESELSQNEFGDFFHYDLHSQMNETSSAKFVKQANEQLDLLRNRLLSIDCLFITIGTSFVYETSRHGVVNNCHKQPTSIFTKSLLSVEEQVELLTQLHHSLSSFNHKIQLFLTLSPVRHTKDGIIQNNLSKSSALLAIHRFMEKRNGVHYFPAYEIMMDDLRDYRYYESDLIHPNDFAKEYIWEQFQSFAFSGQTMNLNKKVTSVRKSLDHRPQLPLSSSYKKHLEMTRRKQYELNVNFPFLVDRW